MYPSNKNVEPIKGSSKIGKGCELDLACSSSDLPVASFYCTTIRDKLSPSP